MVLQHLRTLLWLRWRLTANQWRRGGQINAVIALVVTIVGGGLVVVGGVGGLLLGALVLAQATPLVTMFVWDGIVGVFLFFWLIGLITELQRSEVIDVTRLLHLPVLLREVFFLNYAASHLCLSLAIWGPLTFGLALGLAFGRGAHMLWLLPLLLAFFFMVTAWTYCLRGWLAALMVNQRRRRAVIMGLTMFLIVFAQLPNLLMNVWREDTRRIGAAVAHDSGKGKQVVQVFTSVNRYAPPLWLPQGAQALQAGCVWPGLLATAGMAFIGVLGLARAYQLTRRFYQGDDKRKAVPAIVVMASSAGKVRELLLVERTLPLVPGPAAAVAFANLRSMLRAPEVKMALVANVVVFVILAGGIFLRHHTAVPPAGRPFIALAAACLTVMGLVQLLFNQFGFDRDGFRAIVLLPNERWQILLGKNLALFGIGLPVFLLLLILLGISVHLGVAELVQACLGFCSVLLAVCVLGNWLSILSPYRISPGTLKPTKAKASSQFLLVFVGLFMPLLFLPLFVPPLLGFLCDKYTGVPGVLITLTGAAGLLGCSAMLYGFTLKPLGRLLQRREQRILQAVTHEVE